MRQLLTANVATSLYWLGRYLERTEATLYEINKAYDAIIDVDKDAGVTLYKKFDIDLEYTGALDFLDQAIRGKHAANLADIMKNARENAIISRIHIDPSAFGEIIELEALFKSICKSPLGIDYKDIDHALSLISEIWGVQSKMGHRNASDSFLKLGRLVEEVDFRLRFGMDQEMTDAIVEEIDAMLKVLRPDLAIDIKSSEEGVLADIYATVDKVIVE